MEESSNLYFLQYFFREFHHPPKKTAEGPKVPNKYPKARKKVKLFGEFFQSFTEANGRGKKMELDPPRPWKMNGWNIQITHLERKMI